MESFGSLLDSIWNQNRHAGAIFVRAICAN